ncbi:MarR family winged helix-turn-helix transcriptional regulator [Variovorax sp. J22P271]|uniref:MarR family winged helix-turn-helix transcriptional regulator n=1 Tax=Variovorax davisae TaxID=3053515 RepID=UPI0025775752|nr:MarR family winged helix-turn-helix transcriptional regulator [Variovorax sp. J22P271]MDM0036855.1 MarR family winged helix-turn-helix transcriptional regulator [Variovorax sp. J22P271]
MPEPGSPKVPARRGGALFDVEHSIGYLLNRAANIIAARFSDELKVHGVNLQTWRVLAALSYQDQQSLTDLANHTGAELSYLSRSVASAEARGLVARVVSPADKRAFLLTLTPAGQVLVNELTPHGVRIEKTSVTGVPRADVETTLRTLHAIYHNMVDSTDGSAGMNRKLTVARRVRKRRALDDVADAAR